MNIKQKKQIISITNIFHLIDRAEIKMTKKSSGKKKITKKKKISKKKKSSGKKKIPKKIEEEEEDLNLDSEEEEEDIEEDLDEIEDSMLADDDDQDESRSTDSIKDMMWAIDCPGCDGYKMGCKVKKDFGCPPGTFD